MLISTNWLKRHVDLDGVDLNELADRFLLSVAEVEGIEHVGAGLDTVVLGHVLEVDPIEGARIQRTLVDTGAHGKRQIVCGAPNVAVGQLVPVALPGTTIGDLTIKVAAVRGVESHGMIASEKELGLGPDHDGIMVIDPATVAGAELGTSITALWDVEDVLFEVDNKSLTHRPDLWGHYGIAREVAALLGRELKTLDLTVTYTSDRPLTIEVHDPEACPRYLGVCLEGVTIQPSPMWLKLLLHRVGTRPINHVVDLTNFVMLELGNPLHAFDRRQLAGDTIIVRRAAPGELFKTLDEQDHELTEDDLLIADAQRGVALAGVMGGLNSEIKDDTTRMVLEAANFDAATIRRTGVRHGVRTESSARFEKSLDANIAEAGSRLFCRLLCELDAGVRVSSALQDVYTRLPEPPTITLRPDRVRMKLGAPVTDAYIRETLEAIGFQVVDAADGAFHVTIPSYRATKDVAIEADLVEEIGRFYGYNNVVPSGPQITLSRPHHNRQKRFERAARAYLSYAAGFDEVQTYSFAFDPLLDKLSIPKGNRAVLRNAISSEMPAMRTHLGPNLLGVLERNRRAFDTMSVYEIGRVFLPTEGAPPIQPITLGGLIAAPVDGKDAEAHLFFALKGVLAGLARAIERAPLTLVQGGVDHVWAHPVRQAQLVLGDTTIGYVAELHPTAARTLELDPSKGKAALFELNLDAWRTSALVEGGYTPLPRFPAVHRDFAVVVAESIRADAVREAIATAAPEGCLAHVSFMSVYRGASVGDDRKSMAWSVTLQHPDKTLDEATIGTFVDSVWGNLEREVGGLARA